MGTRETALKRLGELFLIGFEGKSLSDDTSAFLSQAGIGGVVLFAKNYENPAQLAELIAQVQECHTDLPLWVAVDQEGGRVQRFGAPFTRIPPAAVIGRSGSPKTAYTAAEVCAKELKAVGVNVNFAPVCDILTNPANPVIGDRAYGTNEDDVSKMVSAIVRGHIVQGVQPCVKHFPGHGDTTEDSHFKLPSVSTDLATMREREFRPFVKCFKSRCAMTMTAHLLAPALDPDRPATLSHKILQDILRQELRYSRLIVSDDLEMQAITDHFGPEEAPKLAIEAGCDLLIHRSEKAARHAYQSLYGAIEDGRLSSDRVIESAERSRAQKKDSLLPFSPPDPVAAAQVVGCEEHRKLIESIT